MYRCRVCDREFPEPVVKEERLGEFYERVEGCPYCGDPGFEALHPCPTCNGWTAGTICKKCRGRVLHEWGVFLRSLEPEEIEWLQNKVDGDAWDEYR
jgi:hypothetical protein